jgi:hypothetical protein
LNALDSGTDVNSGLRRLDYQSSSDTRYVVLVQRPAMHSHHSHSGQFCRHAKDDLEDIILRAIELGFQTFGLSEHAPRYRLEDLFPEEVSYLSSLIDVS